MLIKKWIGYVIRIRKLFKYFEYESRISLQVRAWKTAGVIGFRACRYAEALIAAADRTIISSSPTSPPLPSSPVLHGSRTVTAIDKSPCRSQTSLQVLLLPSVSVNFVFFPLPPLPSFLPFLSVTVRLLHFRLSSCPPIYT